MNRQFSSAERAALYLAADGRCSRCGEPLEPGWHADHVRPWSRGGTTDVVNGQALCPRCNLTKGDGLISKPRAWQDAALAAYLADAKTDWLLSATPAAGKTRFSTGLGATVDLLRRVVANDPELVGLLDEAIAIEPGQHRATHNVRSRQGNSKDAALRRLRKDRPDLHAQVLAGELSPHRAMVTAGFRRPTFTVPADSPERIAQTLRRHLEPEMLRKLRALLDGQP